MKPISGDWSPRFAIDSEKSMEEAVERFGLLPFLESAFPGYGYSIEEMASPDVWFTGVEGPWEWKNPVIEATGAAYGKFFSGRAGFVSAEWFGDLANVRNGGRSFDERYAEGQASIACRRIFDLLREEGPLTTTEIRLRLDIGRRGRGARSGLEAALTWLSMRCYVVVCGYEYKIRRDGRPYGWPVARHALAEDHFGSDPRDVARNRSGDASRESLMAHLASVLPDVPEGKLAKAIDL